MGKSERGVGSIEDDLKIVEYLLFLPFH